MTSHEIIVMVGTDHPISPDPLQSAWVCASFGVGRSVLRELAWKEGVVIKSTQKTRRMGRKEEKLQASSSLEPRSPAPPGCTTALEH